MIVFIFRRDLRLIDNTGLEEAVRAAADTNTSVLAIFIFTPEQVSSENKFKSDVAVEFMIECINQLKNVQVFYGDNVEVIEALIKNKKFDITQVHFNADHTHYARKRDAAIEKVCVSQGVVCKMHEDYTLQTMGTVQTTSGTFYSVFTPFYNRAMKMPVRRPKMLAPKGKWHTERVSSRYATTLKAMTRRYASNTIKNPHVAGGRVGAKSLLGRLPTEYKETRNHAGVSTSHLSAHIKFGTISIREAYYAFKQVRSRESARALVAQLYWNEFYDQLMYHLPYERTLGRSNYKGLEIKWDDNKHLKNWQEGQTGFPFIDAGMRQLKTTGWMHNRARMAVANFLSMTLLIDWRKGEEHFAKHLIDYDVSQNNGNWQWSAGVGVDRTGYLRMYNPFQQSKKHDPNCEYIKKYVTELSDVPIGHIHEWDAHYSQYNVGYPSPIVNYTERRKIAIEAYKK